MADRDTTKRMFTHMINMMEQHDTMTISCGDPLMELLKDVRELLKEQEVVVRCISCTFYRSDGECALHNGRWKPEGFCSWAIRNEGR